MVRLDTPTIRPPKARRMTVTDGAAMGGESPQPRHNDYSGPRESLMGGGSPMRRHNDARVRAARPVSGPMQRHNDYSGPRESRPGGGIDLSRWRDMARVDDNPREASPWRPGTDSRSFTTRVPPPVAPPTSGPLGLPPGSDRVEDGAQEADAFTVDRPTWDDWRSNTGNEITIPDGPTLPDGRPSPYAMPGDWRGNRETVAGPDPRAGMRDPRMHPGFDGAGPDPWGGRAPLERGGGYVDPGRGGGVLRSAMDQYALEGLRNPSRFDLDMVQQGTALIDRELARGRESAERDLDEFFSGRGLVGSNVEAEERRRLGENLEDQRMRRLMDLNMAMATTHAADRSAAGSLASQVQGMAQQESQFSRSLGQQEAQFARSHGLNEQQFVESQRQFSTSMQERIAGRQQQEAQFARAHGLNVDQFQEQQRQYSTTLAEQIATRMQQENQFARSLHLEHTQLAVQSELQTRALNLQEQGMQLDEAFRRAQLDVETQLQTRALDLQERGMDQEEAYRYAALEQDGNFRQQALDLERQGLTLEESLRGAELGYRQWATTQQLEQDRWRSAESSRLAELDILMRGQGMGLDVELPENTPAPPPITPPGGGGPADPDNPQQTNPFDENDIRHDLRNWFDDWRESTR